MLVKAIIAATITGLLSGAALAQSPAPQDHAPGMMQPGMTMTPEMQQKMMQMMDNCNRMMESKQQKSVAPEKS